MRKNLLLITIAALGSAASIAVMTVPAMTASAMAAPAMAAPATIAEATNAIIRTAEHGTPGALQDEASPDFNFSCPTNWLHGSPITYTVKTTGIHIRQTPASNGTVLYSIAKGASFRSKWTVEITSWHCISPPIDGQQWVLGWDVSNNNHTGWVGKNYLN